MGQLMRNNGWNFTEALMARVALSRNRQAVGQMGKKKLKHFIGVYKQIYKGKGETSGHQCQLCSTWETKGLRKARALPLKTINKDKHDFGRSGAGLTIGCNKHERENTEASSSFSCPISISFTKHSSYSFQSRESKPSHLNPYLSKQNNKHI